MYIHLYVCIHFNIYIYVYSCIHINVYIHILYIYPHMYIYKHKDKYIYMRIYIHICIYTYIHIPQLQSTLKLKHTKTHHSAGATALASCAVVCTGLVSSAWHVVYGATVAHWRSFAANTMSVLLSGIHTMPIHATHYAHPCHTLCPSMPHTMPIHAAAFLAALMTCVAAMRCSVLQCVAVCCNGLQWVAMGCSGLESVAVPQHVVQLLAQSHEAVFQWMHVYMHQVIYVCTCLCLYVYMYGWTYV